MKCKECQVACVRWCIVFVDLIGVEICRLEPRRLENSWTLTIPVGPRLLLNVFYKLLLKVCVIK